LVTEELARAIQHESALALRHWWGVGRSTTERWRRAFGVGRMDSEGSRRVILHAIQTSVVARGEAQLDDEVIWAPEEEALVGVLYDDEVARRTGRTLTAVRQKRKELRRPNPKLPHTRRLFWTPEHEELAMSLPVAEVAERTGHTKAAVLR